jgi:hypothetical protein
MRHRRGWLCLTLVAAAWSANAQWAVYHDPSIPRGRDGKVNLSAPAPRVGGKPDLSGIWIPESAPVEEIKQFLLPEGINGLGETIPSKYFFNFFADVPFGQEPMQPAVRAEFDKRPPGPGKPATLCPLPTVPLEDVLPGPFKIVQTPRVMMLLYEDITVFRQIFTDGRKLPADPQPSWLGYSVGKWVGDAFVAETVGLNDQGGLDVMGHPHSESARVTESFRRRDFGHMEVEITVDDAKTYTKPVSIRVNLRLLADTELIESFCTEDEKDLVHFLAQ